MAFLDDIDRKLTSLGQGALAKTKEGYDSAKISGTIRNLQTQKKDIYTELGKRFYTKYKECADQEDMQLFSKVDQIDQEISQAQKQLSRIKGVIFCPNCNAEIPANSLFCNSCGAKIEHKEEAKSSDQGSICSQCGAHLDEGQLFCSNCGAKVTSGLQSGKHCPDCGASLEEGQVFCTNCGAKIILEDVPEEEIVMDSSDEPVLEAEKEPTEEQRDIVGEYCPKCGAQIENEQVFCTNCGERISR